MNKKKIMCAVGTRPEFIRMAPLIEVIQKSPHLELLFLHTGQHYTYEMDKIFFDELGIPEPTVNLGVGSSSPSSQVAQIILGTEKALNEFKPDIVVVWGDTNSSLGISMATVKAGTPLVHVEAGCRSYDMRMAEEMHRRLIDHAANYLFPVSELCKKILEEEKVPGKIFQLGDPLYDMFLKNSQLVANKSGVLAKLALGPEPYAVLTLHRAENVDNPLTLKTIVNSLAEVAGLKIIFPIHPRTEKRLAEFGLQKSLPEGALRIIPPVGYWDFLVLLKNASLVITDSGGVQKEAFFAKVPCITLRKTTEWLETVEIGANTLIDPESGDLRHLLTKAVGEREVVRKKLAVLKNPYGDGKSAQRIVKQMAAF